MVKACDGRIAPNVRGERLSFSFAALGKIRVRRESVH